MTWRKIPKCWDGPHKLVSIAPHRYYLRTRNKVQLHSPTTANLFVTGVMVNILLPPPDPVASEDTQRQLGTNDIRLLPVPDRDLQPFTMIPQADTQGLDQADEPLKDSYDPEERLSPLSASDNHLMDSHEDFVCDEICRCSDDVCAADPVESCEYVVNQEHNMSYYGIFLVSRRGHICFVRHTMNPLITGHQTDTG